MYKKNQKKAVINMRMATILFVIALTLFNLCILRESAVFADEGWLWPVPKTSGL